MQTSFEPICPLCGEHFDKTRLIVLCPNCHVMYHHDCWEQNGGCAISNCPLGSGGCTGTQSAAQPDGNGDLDTACAQPAVGDNAAAAMLEKRPSAASASAALCKNCGGELLPDALFCRHCGHAQTQELPQHTVAQPSMPPVTAAPVDEAAQQPVVVPPTAPSSASVPVWERPKPAAAPQAPVCEQPVSAPTPPPVPPAKAAETCPKCGKRLKEGYAFCPRCGAPLDL